jgi:hypothetical protein
MIHVHVLHVTLSCTCPFLPYAIMPLVCPQLSPDQISPDAVGRPHLAMQFKCEIGRTFREGNGEIDMYAAAAQSNA